MFANRYTQHLSQKLLKQLDKQAQSIITLAESRYAQMTPESLRQAFDALRQETDLSSEKTRSQGFAIIRCMTKHILGMEQYPVQIVGGLALLQNTLAEMRTGEGKTLTVAAAAAMHAIAGKGVHVVTANPYLAQRDAEILLPLYQALGLTVGVLKDGLSNDERRAMYQCDITYGTGSDFGFDYLRDNITIDSSTRVQRGRYAAIVDEIDSILIDEARIPMILSQEVEYDMTSVQVLSQIVSKLEPAVDYTVDIKEHVATFTDVGYQKLENSIQEQLSHSSAALYHTHLYLVQQAQSALTAHTLYRKDKDYVVRNGEVMLVDQSTGRIMDGRRLQDGLHEALEAKEGVDIKKSSQTLATVTFQNFFSAYENLSGLTGTALTEAEEFLEVYQLQTVVIPPNRPLQRVVHPDSFYADRRSKHLAMLEQVKACHQKQQPVLIGFGAINEAEQFSHVLTQAGLRHEVLSAKHISKEAQIIANAGALGSITIATNMAGRGTDISLGGEKPQREHFSSDSEFAAAVAVWRGNADAVIALGGLFVIGGERNGIRRVDNQLAGRCARQGDPGHVKFYLSLDDDLMKRFATAGNMDMLRQALQQSNGLSGKFVNKVLTRVQQRIEGEGFTARKQVMKYDSVMAEQRNALFSFQEFIFHEASDAQVADHFAVVVEHVVQAWAEKHLDKGVYPDMWDLAAIKTALEAQFGINAPIFKWVNVENLDYTDIVDRLQEEMQQHIQSRALDANLLRESLHELIQQLWPQHLTSLMDLEKSMNLRGTLGKDLYVLFAKDAFDMYVAFQSELESTWVAQMLSLEYLAAKKEREQALLDKQLAAQQVQDTLQSRWIARNEPCPCGSSLAFKRCHGKLVNT